MDPLSESDGNTLIRKPASRRGLRFGRLLGLAGALLLLCAGVAEVALRLAGYGAIYDVYSKPSMLWRYDELLGWSHEPNASGVYVGPRPWPIEFEAPIHINSLGLRGPEVEELGPGGYRVLVLGDSVPAGFEVPYQETFVARLEEALNARFEQPVQVINAGVRGYGTDQNYLYYRERGSSLKPQLVILVHSDNDPENNVTLHRMRRLFGKPVFVPAPDGSLVLRGTPVPEYPLCSAYVLDESFATVRVDTYRVRTLCWLQTQLADESALFTFFTLRIRNYPRLLRFFYDLGSPQTGSRRTATPSLAAVGGFAGWGTQAADRAAPSARVRGARYELTSLLIRELAAEVRRNGSAFVLVISERALDRLDRAALVADGIEIQYPERSLGYLPLRALRFRADSHLSAQGHETLARFLVPIVAKHIREAEMSREGAERESRDPTPVPPTAHLERPPVALSRGGVREPDGPARRISSAGGRTPSD